MGAEAVAEAVFSLHGRRRCLLAAIVLFLTVLTLSHVLYEAPSVGQTRGSPAFSETIPITPRLRTIIAYALEARFLPPSPPVHRCQDLKYPVRKAQNENEDPWQQPEGTTLYSFSAYYDARLEDEGDPRHFVRVIAMREGDSHVPTVYCRLWYERDEEPLVVEAVATDIWVGEWGNVNVDAVYTPLLVSCAIPPGWASGGRVPFSLSLAPEPCVTTSSLVSVRSDGYSEGWKVKMDRGGVAVCVKGMDFAEDRSARLVEWLELVHLLGAGRIFVYLYGVHHNMSRVLGYYAQRGLVEVVPLTLPGRQPNFPPSIRSLYLRNHLWQKRRNELIPYNDCFYRNIYRFEFVLPIDVDEVILPVKSNTWSSLLEEVSSREPHVMRSYASLSVRNAYFFDNFPSEKGARLHMLSHLVRSANFSRPGQSVKSFVSTRNALTVFNHYALQPIHPAIKKDFLVGDDIAQMNHYKTECSPVLLPDCYSNFLRFTKKDTLILKYGKELSEKVDHVLKELHLS